MSRDEYILISEMTDIRGKMYSLMSDSFSGWIQERLEEKGWSQAELARRSGLTRGGISNLLNNVRKPDAETCKALARAFGRPEEEALIAAGYLSPKPDFDPRAERLNQLFDQLTPEDQEEILSIAEMKLRKKEAREAEKQKKKPLTNLE